MTALRVIVFLPWVLSASATESESVSPFRRMFDASQVLMTGHGDPGAKFPENKFNTMLQCMDISPNLVKAQDHVWGGFVEYFAANQNASASDPWGKFPVPWVESYQHRNSSHYTGSSNLQTLAYDESLPSIPIYEPCNFVSNFAYYRVAPEICHKAASQSMSQASRRGFVESLTVLGFGSAFFHASDTALGNKFDTTMIQVLAFVGHQVAVEHLPTLGKPEILRDLTETPQNRSATEISSKLTNGLLASPPSQWRALLPKEDKGPAHPKDLPRFEFIFAGLVSAVLEGSLPSAINKKLVPFLMGLFGMSQEKKSFIVDKFLPTISESLSQVRLRLVDRVALLRKLLAFAIKIVFAFAFQESYFNIDFFLRKDVNLLGGLLLPALNVLGDVLSGDIWWEKGIPLGLKVYPGDEKCRLNQPHAKWHEMSANAFLELVYMADKMNRMTSPEYASKIKSSDLEGDDAIVFTLAEFQGWSDQARMLSFATPARASVEAFTKEIKGAFEAVDANADGSVTYNELVFKLGDMAAKDEIHLSQPEAFVERLLQASAAQDEIMV